MKKVGIFTQIREFEGREYNNLSPDYVASVEAVGGFALIVPAFSGNVEKYIEICDAFIFSG
jgi:gamma-glutamyl-gamma-aminobutyrate hydrolase PuuD